MEYTSSVLVVDDSEMIIKMLGFMISRAGYIVLTADNGRNALELLDGRDIDLVITDLNMPEMGGIELTREIRRKEYYSYVPVVLFSSDGEQDKRKLLDTSGATILFDKADIKEKMISIIKKLLG